MDLGRDAGAAFRRHHLPLIAPTLIAGWLLASPCRWTIW